MRLVALLRSVSHASPRAPCCSPPRRARIAFPAQMSSSQCVTVLLVFTNSSLRVQSQGNRTNKTDFVDKVRSALYLCAPTRSVSCCTPPRRARIAFPSHPCPNVRPFFTTLRISALWLLASGGGSALVAQAHSSSNKPVLRAGHTAATVPWRRCMSALFHTVSNRVCWSLS